ncbi:CIA30 family protein, partial [Arsukibacterium sp.]|uniref:CIA30 family protein n=1 Tax=Arsukibacterium sp. TaxID=1977258 RepID=UPI003565612A
VMGGRSTGSVKAVSEPVGLRFFGDLSLANNGGFASAEFRLAKKIPSVPYRSIKLNVAADGRQYQLRLKTPFIPQGVAYVADFKSAIDQLNYYFQHSDFNGRYRGRLVPNMPKLRFADVSHISVMLADKNSGAFSTVLYSISLSTAPVP